MSGAVVIWVRLTFETPVIFAEAEIRSANLLQCDVDGLDSRFRGKDQCFEVDSIPNGTTPSVRQVLTG
jgi:hypothetical protein